MFKAVKILMEKVKIQVGVLLLHEVLIDYIKHVE